MSLALRIKLTVVAAIACLALTVSAQETQPPASEKKPSQASKAAGSKKAKSAPKKAEKAVQTPKQPSAEDIVREFQKQRPAPEPVLPRGQADETINRAPQAADAPPKKIRPLLPDGYMLVDRTGRLTQEANRWFFIFESDNDTHPEPPMKLLECQTLERMVRASRGGVDAVVFVVTGEVTDFRGENFLLPRKALRKRDLGNLKK